MSKILVTGASGFIGDYVVSALLRKGHDVIVSYRSEERMDTKMWKDSVKRIPLDIGDIGLDKDYYQFFEMPDRMIHLAWSGLPDYKSLDHFEKYLWQHYNFLKNMIVHGLKDLTVTGTCFEYGMKNGELSETDAEQPGNPYGLAKLTLFRFLQQLSAIVPFHLKWARLFYMFGAGQNPRSLFSQLEKAIANGDVEFNMSGGEQIRDFLPAETMAHYLTEIALQEKVQGIINCCSGQPVRVKDAVLHYLRNKGSNIKLNLGFYPYPDYEPMEFWGNNKKLQSILHEQ